MIVYWEPPLAPVEPETLRHGVGFLAATLIAQVNEAEMHESMMIEAKQDAWPSRVGVDECGRRPGRDQAARGAVVGGSALVS